MKIAFVLVCTCAIFLIKKARGSAIGAPFYPLNPEDLSDGDIKEIEYFDKYYHRPKRTLGHPLGSAGVIIQVKTAAINGAAKKIIEIARSSVGSAVGTVVAASTGAKHAAGNAAKGLGGALLGSAGGIHMLKSALGAEAQKKLSSLAKASAGAATGAIAAASTKAGHTGKAALGAVAGSAGAVKQLQAAAINGLIGKVGAIASGSAKHITGASAGLGQASHGAISGSVGAVNALKHAALSGLTSKIGKVASGSAGALTGLATAGSAGATHAAKGLTHALTGSANAVNQLKLAFAAEINNKLGQIASGSAKAATGASAGFHTKVKQVSGDIAIGGIDVANQLKTAIHAGSKKKLGQAASGLAGALAGAVGSASAGLGQITRGVVSGSTHLANELKSQIFQGTQKKIGQALSASAAASGHATKSAGFALQGSAAAINQLKHALLLAVKTHVAQLASGSVKTVGGASGLATQGATAALAGSAGAVKHLKNALVSQVGQVALGSATAASGASNQVKHGVTNHIKSTIGKVALGSASAATGASKSAGSAVIGSANAVNQLKNAALSHITTKIGQVVQGSVAAGGQASNALNQAKHAAVSQLTSKIGQVAKGSATAVIGGSGQLSKGSILHVHKTLKRTASGIADASGNFEAGIASSVSGSAQAVHKLKSAALGALHHQVSNLAEASVEISKRSVSGFPPEQLEQHLHHEVVIDLPKRSESAWSTGSGSGSADILNHLKSAIVSGLKQKIGQVARGSAGALAGASAGFSKGSFGGDSKGYHYHTYEPSPHDVDEHKGYNVWELKKSVLNTLLQAVKAIKGGVLAIKGQLIKGSGYIVSGSGKLIAASGDKVTSLGKNIINNAVLVPPNKDHYTHSDHGSHSSSYTAPSGPSVVYNAPSSSGHGYESHYESQHYDHNDKPHGTHAGILILRRLPSTHDKYHSSHSHIDESIVPAFKPLSPTGPTFGTVVGKFLSAASSLSPSGPSPFTDSDIHPYDTHSSDHYVAAESHGSLSPPSPPHFEEPHHHYQSPPVSYQAPLIKEHKVAPTLSNVDFGTSSNNFGNYIQPSSALTTNYGVPFEQSVGFQNINDHIGAETSVNEQKVKLTKGEILDHLEGAPTLASSQVEVPKDAPESLQTFKQSVGNNDHTLGPPFSSDYLPNDPRGSKAIASGEVLPSQSASANYIRNALYAERDNVVPESHSKTKITSPQELPSNDPLADFLPHEDSSLSFSGSQEISNELTSHESYMKFLENFPFHKVHPTSSPSYKKRPTSKSYSSQRLKMLRAQQSEQHRLRKPSHKPDFSVVKSVSYEITPNGAKRLT